MTAPSDGPIVTLDGPAGSGKSSTAKAVARRLGFRHLDSGALYRAITLGILRSAIPEERWPGLTADDFHALQVDLAPTSSGFRVFVRGEEVTDELRTPEVTAAVPRVASLPGVRASLLSLQRAAGSHGSLVADGRDMGSEVFPDAEVKIFLVADVEERARRRLREMGAGAADPVEVGRQAEELAGRDRHDSQRKASPLRRPPDAHIIDTTGLDFADQVQAVVDLVDRLTTP